MRYPIKAQGESRSFEPVITLGTTGAKSPGEILETLDKMRLEWYVTEGGSLMIKYWQTIAENFVPPEHAAIIRSSRQSSEQGDELDWLSKNLQNIREKYGGQWVAIDNNEIVASTPDLSELLNKITAFDRPFITFIPVDPVVWTFTYAY